MYGRWIEEKEVTDDLQRSLGRIEGSLEEILRRLENYENRISSLEQKVWRWSGAFVVIMIVWTFISHKIALALGLR